VVVDFIAGEPDRPIIVGCTYNADQMPPFVSPTQSGFISRSMNGTPGNANALRFEDAPGAEELWLHAERDHRLSVENDKYNEVGNDHTEVIGRHASQRVSGKKSTLIALDYDHTVDGASTRRVALDANNHYGQSFFQTITQNHNATVFGNKSTSVTGNTVFNHAGTFLLSVTGPATQTFDNAVVEEFKSTYGAIHRGAYELDAKNTYRIEADQTYDIFAKGDVTIDANSAKVTIKGNGGVDISSNVDITVTSQTKVHLDAPTVKAKSRDIDWTVTPKKLDLIGLRVQATGLELSGHGARIGLSLHTNGFSVFNCSHTVWKSDIYMTKTDLGVLKIEDQAMRKENAALNWKSGFLHLIW